MAAILHDNYTGDTADGTVAMNAANDWAGQSFTTSVAYSISRIDVYLAKGVGDDVGNVTVAIYAVDGSGHPAGGALASGTIANAVITEAGTYTWNECTLGSAYNLSNNTKYCIVVHGTSLDASNVLYWPFWDDGAGASAFAGGDTEWSTTGGVPGGWATDTTTDFLFKCWGDTAPQSDKVYSNSLVAIGNHEVWYESTAGTMTEFAAANAQINTSNPLTVTEAFQKVFIANEVNLKVTDFVNTKIATADVGTHPPDFGTILTGDTSVAKMVVDYVTSITADAATVIYGKRITSATFVASETISGTDDDGNDIDFNMTAVAEVAPPHWYSWTTFGDDVTFGAMPDSAYLVCRYRGRLVLSGNPNYPHQWYMSKIGNPWDWLYSTTNPLTAVAGNNTDAGEIGDIVRALIPYGDDFLVFGCANSIHVLDGDPASGGSIDELSDTTGIYSWTSWCRDDDGNLYFYGRNGVYMMQGGRSKPTNISKAHLPQLASDWAIDPTLHKIVMAYDAERQGILIFKTTISDGTCVGYFYSLETQGYYPITLQTECGVFSAFDYNSDTVADRALLFGSNDGYIRGFSDSDKDDNVGATTDPISSYFGMVEKITEDDDKNGLLSSLTVEMVGGFEYRLTHAALTIPHIKDDVLTQATSTATMIVDFTDSTKTHTFGHTITGTWDTTNAVTSDGDGSGFTPTAVGVGSFANSDGCSYEYHKADDAETALEYLKDGAAAFATGTLSGTGRKYRIRTRLKGAWLALKFYNSTAAETFGINRIFGIVSQKGKIK